MQQTELFCHIGPFFALLPPYHPEEWIFHKNEKKSLEISSFNTSVPKITIICFLVPDIWHVTDVIIFHFGQFLPFCPLNTQKTKTFIKWTKCLEILSFNTSVIKMMIICYTVPETWHLTDVIVVFHFGLFFTPLFP